MHTPARPTLAVLSVDGSARPASAELERYGQRVKLGGWKVEGRLGTGGMGEVYLAHRGGQTAALKLIRQELATDPTFRARFEREVEACRRVKGDRVAVLLDADITGPRAWMAVTYVPGPTLAEHVEAKGPLRGENLAGLAVGLADALDAIHSVGVIHRDLKPANVILTQTQPVVIDFGVAAAHDVAALTATGAFVGTPGWIAPEAMSGTARADPQQDVWAWGATVLFAATGGSPHGDGPVVALHWRAANQEPDPTLTQQVPEPLRALVTQALATDPGARPPAASLMHRVLDTLGAARVAPGTVIAETWAPGSLGMSAPPRARKSGRWPIVAAASVALGGAVGAGWWFATIDQRYDEDATAISTNTSTSTTASPPPTTAQPVPSTTVPTTAPPAPSPLGQRPPLQVGEASGSGCTPGPGALPDGWWFGYPTSPVGNGPAFGFDLACFNLEAGSVGAFTVTNDSQGIREVPLAPGADLICLFVGQGSVEEDRCASSTPGSGEQRAVWVRIEDGQASRVLEQHTP